MFTHINNALEANFSFDNFIDAFAFMTQVAFHCEKMNHHPNWSNVYNTVHIKLTTHDAGNVVTDKDRDLSKVIEQIYNTK